MSVLHSIVEVSEGLLPTFVSFLGTKESVVPVLPDLGTLKAKLVTNDGQRKHDPARDSALEDYVLKILDFSSEITAAQICFWLGPAMVLLAILDALDNDAPRLGAAMLNLGWVPVLLSLVSSAVGLRYCGATSSGSLHKYVCHPLYALIFVSGPVIGIKIYLA